MPKKQNVVILGAGVAGLSLGYFLAQNDKYQVTVLEKEAVVGGMCGSFRHLDFTLDYGAHKIYSTIPGVLEDIRLMMGDRLIEIPKRNNIFLQDHSLDYPLRLGNLMKVMGIPLFLKLGFGYFLILLKSIFPQKAPSNYEEYMIRCFGRPAYQLVFEPLAEKVWGDPKQLHPEMARTRVPSSGGMEIIFKLLGLKKETAQTNAAFFYYPHKGYYDFCECLRENIEAKGGEVVTGLEIDAIAKADQKIKKIIGRQGDRQREFSSDMLVSTIPLPKLVRYLFNEGEEAHKAADALAFRHLVLVYLFIDQPKVLDAQWMFFPERKFIFSRIFEQKQMNPDLGPSEKTAVCCDFTCDQESWQWKAEDRTLAEKCIDGLCEAGFIRKEDVKSFLVKRVENFYPNYDLKYQPKLARLYAPLKKFDNLLLSGRLGTYNYNNADHCFDMGRFIAEKIGEREEICDIWRELENRSQTYRIVD